MVVQDISFALLIIGVNILVFLLFNIRERVTVKKRKLFLPLAVMLAVLVVLLAQNHERYIVNFNSVIALILLMVVRAVLYKVSSIHPKDDVRLKVIWNFFDAYVFPFFFIFFSVAQCIILILINLNE